MSESIVDNGNASKLAESKVEIVNTIIEEAIQAPDYDLQRFSLTRILHNNTVRKSVALLGTFPHLSETNAAIVLFEKQAFQEHEVQTSDAKALDTERNNSKTSYFSDDLKVQVEFINNIYGSFMCRPSGDLNAVKTTVVYPATEKHIEKYSICQKYLISETPTLYENVTLPYIKACQFSLDWVYNILEHKQETERIVYEDDDPETGFVLLPDLKWDGKNAETLYLLGITHKHHLKSLRDLTAEHLPLLRNIRERTAAAVEKRYGLTMTQLRMYFHYQPSFYHLHVHVNPIRNDAPGIWCEKSHMLETVISNLELMPDYYQRVTLPVVLYEGNKLLDLYEEQFQVRNRVKLTTDEKRADVTADRVENNGKNDADDV